MGWKGTRAGQSGLDCDMDGTVCTVPTTLYIFVQYKKEHKDTNIPIYLKAVYYKEDRKLGKLG